MDPRIREDDAGTGHACALIVIRAPAVIPAPFPSFLRRQESIPAFCLQLPNNNRGANFARWRLKNDFTLRTFASLVKSRCASAR